MTEEHKAAIAEGRRKAKERRETEKATEKVVVSAPKKKMLGVTYKPLDAGDPSFMTWNGVEFHANVPVQLRSYSGEELKRLSDRINNVVRGDINDIGHVQGSKFHVILIPRSRIIMVDGMPRSSEYQELIPMVELAKRNPSFEVEGFPRFKRIVPLKKVPPAGAEWEGTNRDELIPASQMGVDTSVFSDGDFDEITVG